MAYEVEDEVDWSDGTLDEPPSTSTGVSGDSGYVSPTAHETDGLDYLFEPQDEDEHDVPLGTALPPAPEHLTPTRAQRARIGVHLDRRQPSEQDYAHFALYQANQKAYEATFLKHFVNHALHPSQIEQCFQDGVDARASVQEYIASVSANVNGLTNKMIWNAHCRTVNLLANAGKDGAPFWDVCAFDRTLFADFGPSNASPIAYKMKESWHRAAPKPPMVRYTTKNYPIGHHSSPFEEIDEVADALFNREAFGSSLPTGRVIKQPTERKVKGRGLPGASVRDPIEATCRDNWLASLIPSVTSAEHRESSRAGVEPVETHGDTVAPAEPRLIHDPRQLQDQAITATDHRVETVPPEPLHTDSSYCSGELTQLEQLISQFGANALSDHPSTNTAPSQEQVDQVPTWPTRLFQDHKRRLALRSPQVFRRALPSIRAVIAEALEQGYRPVDPDFEERIVNIESREQSDAVSVEASAEALEAETIALHPEQEAVPSGHESSPCKKRKREQLAPIRMFNKPIERPKKRRKTDAIVVGTARPSTLPEAADRPRKQKITTSISVGSAPKMKPEKKRTSRSVPDAASSSAPLSPHPSGSTTLESHQHLPPDAYFTPQSPDEKPVWRCGIKHALGHYYNAGDRKNCPGCFTALSDNTSAVTMDFYLPSRTHYRQPNPCTSWRPSKPFGATYNRARRSKHLSHNSIAKEVYWSAISSGSSPDDARTTATAAVLAHLAPKPPPKEPTPAPTPSPEPDPSPHPSGSTTMEHTQDIPLCAYFAKRDRHEEFAWRCDVNHALGRYYLAGDKRTCPGCGSNKGGLGKSLVMDFYLPLGVVVRQEVGEVRWRARRPYRMRADDRPGASGARGGKEGMRNKKKKECTHNQVASRKYWEAVDAGQFPEDALIWAVRETDRWLDEREDEAGRQAEEREVARDKKSKASKGSDESSTMTASTALNAARQQVARSVSDSGSDTDEAERDETDDEMHDALVAAFEEQSSADELSSESDSE